MIPFVMTWDGVVTKHHRRHMKEMGTTRNIEAHVQSMVGASEDAWFHARKPRAHADGSILSAQAARLTMGVSANPTLQA